MTKKIQEFHVKLKVN